MGDEILDRRLPPEHRDRFQEYRRIRARRREPVGDDALDISVDVPGPGEELAPERITTGPVGDRRCGPRIQRRVHRHRERHYRVMVQWSERHPRQTVAE